MTHTIFQVGTFEVNCTILVNDASAWIVDPGHEADRLCAFLKQRNLQPRAILLTHGHFDHIGAIPALQTAFPDLPVVVHAKDAPMLTHPLNQLPPDYPPIASVAKLLEPRELAKTVGLADIEVIETPGHTPGGVCYYLPQEKLLLSGDTLFAGSIGRTDLPGGDMGTLMNSLLRLTALPDDTTIIPGHGGRTTIRREKDDNPFLR